MTIARISRRLCAPLLLGLVLLTPLTASATLIGDQVSVLLNIYFASATPTEVFNETAVVADPGGPELTAILPIDYGGDGTATLSISLDLLGDGFQLNFQCTGPDIGNFSGCQFGYDDGGGDGSPASLLGFALSLSDLDWISPPSSLTGVDVEFGGNFGVTGDVMVEIDPVITASSYSASFSGSDLGTGGPSPDGSVTGSFTVVRDVQNVPEPSVMLLLALGLALLAGHARRQRMSRIPVATGSRP
jgi:hypothetical protein